MTPTQREQLKEARKRMIDLDLTVGSIAETLGTSPTMISQLVGGHRYYPRFAQALKDKFQIYIPDTRDLRRSVSAKTTV